LSIDPINAAVNELDRLLAPETGGGAFWEHEKIIVAQWLMEQIANFGPSKQQGNKS
jgi:hypothetical protein